MLHNIFRYYISKAQFINANDAKIACQARGKYWDLAIIEDKQEHNFLNQRIGGCVPYWLGMTNPSGTELKDHQGLDVTFAQWDTHLGIAQKSSILSCFLDSRSKYYCLDIRLDAVLSLKRTRIFSK